MRALSSTIQSVLGKQATSALHLLSFSVGETNYFFAEDLVVFHGNAYLPHLILDSPVRYDQSLQSKPTTVKLQNVSLDMAALLRQQQSAIQGAEATLERLYLAANEAVTLLVNLITRLDIDEQVVTLTLDYDLDPTASTVPKRAYSQLCMWKFKDSNCGYTDFADPLDPATALPFVTCPKDFLSCQARGRQHRFPGFVSLVANLTQAVQGQAPYTVPPQTLSSVLVPPWETP